MDKNSYTEINSKVIDAWVESGWEWGTPISSEDFSKACGGDFQIVLTPCKPVPMEWFAPYLKNSSLQGVKLLGLASGGGQQMPVMAALGADCTVLDYSEKQLESERIVAEREGYQIEIVKADMTKRLPFDDETFDMVIHPVSNCYVEDVCHIWNECFRVLKKGGVLLAGMDNGFNYLFDEPEDGAPLTVVNKLPFNPLKAPALLEKLMKLDDGVQFSHTIEEQLGGQLKAGLVLTDLYEDKDSTGILSEYYPQYIATRAVKPATSKG